MAKIILDAGHGGNDVGDIYGNRYEKDDNLKLTLAIGNRLQAYGIEPVYTRITDRYVSHLDRSTIANREEGDFLLSVHRIIGEIPLSEAGLGFYIYSRGGMSEAAAANIAKELAALGFIGYDVTIRTDHPILRDTKMPALMLGIGYLNSEADNRLFDTRLEDIAEAIARGLDNTLQEYNASRKTPAFYTATRTNQIFERNDRMTYQYFTVQVGLFRNFDNALNLQAELIQRGCPAEIFRQGDFYAVSVGYFQNMDEAAELERWLRTVGYDTFLVAR